jgi:hypothetical protein
MVGPAGRIHSSSTPPRRRRRRRRRPGRRSATAPRPSAPLCVQRRWRFGGPATRAARVIIPAGRAGAEPAARFPATAAGAAPAAEVAAAAAAAAAAGARGRACRPGPASGAARPGWGAGAWGARRRAAGGGSGPRRRRGLRPGGAGARRSGRGWRAARRGGSPGGRRGGGGAAAGVAPFRGSEGRCCAGQWRWRCGGAEAQHRRLRYYAARGARRIRASGAILGSGTRCTDGQQRRRLWCHARRRRRSCKERGFGRHAMGRRGMYSESKRIKKTFPYKQLASVCSGGRAALVSCNSCFHRACVY